MSKLGNASFWALSDGYIYYSGPIMCPLQLSPELRPLFPIKSPAGCDQGEGLVCDLFPKQWFIPQRIWSVTMEKSWTPIDSYCKNFNSLILSCHTWNILKKCSSQIYKQWKSDLNTSWICFMCDNSELSCWNFYNRSQWVFMIFPLSQMGSFGE